MAVWLSFILGLIQGFTEFLPISSSGHLVLVQKLFNLKPPIFFDIFVHIATLLAIVVYLFKEFKRLKSIKILTLLFVGSLPSAILGLFLRSKLEIIFDSYLILGFSFLLSSLLLFLTRNLKKPTKTLENLKIKDAFLIGCFQSVALLPGVSRSGSTIVAGLLLGLKNTEAFYFSLLLALPAVSGAALLEILKTGLPANFEGEMGGIIMAFISGLICLRLLAKILKKGKFFYFGFYCLFLGLLALYLNF